MFTFTIECAKIFFGDDMEKFIEDYNFIRPFSYEGDFYLKYLGYNDFEKIAPIKRPRVQDFYTLHYVISGGGTLMLEDRVYKVKAGELFFLPPQAQIMYYPDRHALWEYVWFAFDGIKAAEYGRKMGFSFEKPVKEALPDGQVLLCLRRLLDRIRIDPGDGYFMALSAFYELMHLCSTEEPSQGAWKMKKLIDQSFTAPDFSIEQLCRTLHISHAQLCRIFKAAYGVTAVKYLVSCRLNLAAKLLETTLLPVKTVAASCGFHDELHFMKTFKKTFGLSALTYRTERKKL